MELTPERRKCLQVVSAAGGRMSHDDERLAPFCDDKSTLTKPDVFNQCHDAAWLHTTHDSDTSASIVHLTDAGRFVLRGSF